MNLDWRDFGDYLDGWHLYNGYAMANCVWHDDHNPSMRVSERGYFCLSCGAGGSLNRLHQKVGNVPHLPVPYSPNPSAQIWGRWEEKFGDIKSICSIAHRSILNDPNLGNYLYKRGFDAVSIKFGILGYLEGYYVFPIRDEWGEVQGAVIRASPTIQTKTNRYSVYPNSEVKIYVPDWDEVKKAERLYVCYGIIDAWALHFAGYASITGISGQELNAENLTQFRKPMTGISDLGEESNMVRLQSQLGWRMQAIRLDYPDGCKDISDIYMKHGKEKLRELIEEKETQYACKRISSVV